MNDSLIDPVTVSGNWESRGFSFGVFTDPPGQVWENFVHETDELLMLVRGELILEMEGRAIDCVPGEEVLIPAGKNHSVRNPGKTENVWFYGYKKSG